MVALTDFTKGGQPENGTERLILIEITESLLANVNFHLAASGTI